MDLYRVVVKQGPKAQGQYFCPMGTSYFKSVTSLEQQEYNVNDTCDLRPMEKGSPIVHLEHPTPAAHS